MQPGETDTDGSTNKNAMARTSTIQITPYTNPATGSVSLRVSGTIKGQRRRVNLSGPNAEDEALTLKQTWEREVADIGALPTVPTTLTIEQAREAEACFHRLQTSKVPLTMAAALEFALTHWKPAQKRILVPDAIQSFLLEREGENKRSAHIKGLKVRLSRLGTAHAKDHVDEVTHDAMLALIHREGSGPVNKNNDRRALCNFFNWCVTKKYCGESPMIGINPIEQDDREPEIMPLERVRRLLAAAAAHKDGALVPYVALCLFCGIRPDGEIQRLTWDNIDLEQGLVTVSGKMRGRRVVEVVSLQDQDAEGHKVTLPANVVEWLRPHANKTPLVGSNWRNEFAKVKEAAGYGTPTEENPKLVPWPTDVMRHTAISYHFALCEHEGKTARWAGNSPDIIHQHYKGLVKPKDVRAFWSMTPDRVSGDNIVPMVAANGR